MLSYVSVPWTGLEFDVIVLLHDEAIKTTTGFQLSEFFTDFITRYQFCFCHFFYTGSLFFIHL